MTGNRTSDPLVPRPVLRAARANVITLKVSIWLASTDKNYIYTKLTVGFLSFKVHFTINLLSEIAFYVCRGNDRIS